VKIIQMGLGPIGLDLIRCVRVHGHEIVGAIDNDPDKLERSLGDLLGERSGGVRVVSDLREVEKSADVVLHATGSRLTQVASQLEGCIEQGLNVVSTCEELFYPWRRDPQVAGRLDTRAKNAGVTVIGAGVNPGFAMDVLALAATIPCWSVRAVNVIRVVDAQTRRLPLQKKIGVGLSPEQFDAGVMKGELGHVGLGDSAWTICDRLGLPGEGITETIRPLVASEEHHNQSSPVLPGDVAGLHQVAIINGSGRDIVRLELTMSVGAEDARDVIRIDGNPPVSLVVPGGLPGEASTAGVVLNTARRAIEARPGLLSILDLPLPYLSLSNSSPLENDEVMTSSG
jgi:2,4-diaminopentanoate dehydrogenase